MKLILVRHGETEENLKGILAGHLPGRLSENGLNQIRKVALRLKDEKIDFIYSSDLTRASDTAKEIAKFHTEVPIEFVRNLRERYLGEWQGKSRKELKFMEDTSPTNISLNDRENSQELFNRAKDFLEKVLLKHSKEVVLFVGHDGINRAIIAAITNKDLKEMKLIERQHNTSITVFKIDEDKNYKTLLFNSIEHLN